MPLDTVKRLIELGGPSSMSPPIEAHLDRRHHQYISANRDEYDPENSINLQRTRSKLKCVNGSICSEAPARLKFASDENYSFGDKWQKSKLFSLTRWSDHRHEKDGHRRGFQPHFQKFGYDFECRWRIITSCCSGRRERENRHTCTPRLRQGGQN